MSEANNPVFSSGLSKREIVRRADAMVRDLNERNERQKDGLTRLIARDEQIMGVCREAVSLSRAWAGGEDMSVERNRLRAKAELATEILGILGVTS